MGKSGIRGLDAFKKIVDNDFVSQSVLDALNKIGEFALSQAPALHGFENKTFNLEDSYAYAIYKDGTLNIGPVLTDKKATEPNPDEYGRDMADDYLKGISPSGSYTLVIVANTVYAAEVEMSGRDVMISLEWETTNEAKKVFDNLKWRKL